MSEADLEARVKPMGEPGQKLLSAYRAAYPDYSPTYLWIQMISARVMQGTEFVAAQKAAKGHAPAYVWFMTWETPVQGGIFKTPHTMELPFSLYSFDKVRTYVGEGPEPKRMAEQIAGAWVAFARTGKPDHPGIPHWPPFTATDRSVMEFNLPSRVVQDPLGAVRSILAQMSPGAMPRA